MRAIRGEPVEVWMRHGKPARFIWRGRMYTVMFVLDRRMLPPSAPPGEPDPDSLPEPGDRELWRVEATPERIVPPATYELHHDLTTDRWTLSRG
jgi:Family of unknown function (DUF6504)